MKEAAGEANMTVITIVLIAIVLAAGTLIVTNIMSGMKNNKQTLCSQLGGAYNGSVCTCPTGSTNATVTMQVTDGKATNCNNVSVTVE